MNYAINQDSQRYTIAAKISTLMQDLQNLAPHPDQPNNKGPLFIGANPHFKAANDHDGMLGSMIMESLLGTAFAEAVSETIGSWAQEVDLNSVMECYSEYITDVEASKAAAHGQGTLARLSGKSISGSFNMRSTISEGMQAFMEDLPKRMEIERNLAHYAKQLSMLDAPQAAPQYAAPKPRFAA